MGEAYVIIETAKVAADAGGHSQVVILPVYKRQGWDPQTRTADGYKPQGLRIYNIVLIRLIWPPQLSKCMGRKMIRNLMC